jgi:DNA-binding MarR family transcriptional regulator
LDRRPKRLSERSGLAPASITGLVDRLERKGFARRRQHPDDRRRVLVETRPERLERLAELFVDWANSLEQLYVAHSDRELETISIS